MIGAAESAYSGVDVHFNLAGRAVRRAALFEIDNALWKEVLKINVNGVFYGMQACVA